ncbi:MAG: alpha/beta hydrolase [Oscillospiraceae bacterium]|jgi:fermentation-respiration switch protein FrsA (DUF1100 family)|nr:alpha/beta hydrolase [Oscillospiraceae bacterium]
MRFKKNKKRKILIAVSTALFLLIGVYFFVGNYFYNYAIARTQKSFMENNPKLPNSEHKNEEKSSVAVFKTDNKKWLEETPQNDEEITSFDGLKLSATSFKNESSNKWIIAVHGYASNRTRLYDRVQGFFEQGFNVLSIDCRGCGKSQGDFMTMGLLDRLDVIDWCKMIIEKQPKCEIVLYGTSMGGATVMMASGENEILPKNIKCIVEDCGYTSARNIFCFQLKDQFGLPPFPIINALNLVTKIRAKFDLNQASCIEQLKKNKLPIMFIHGTKDEFVPFDMVHELFKSTNAEKKLYTVNGAGHNCAFKQEPRKYMEKVLEFIFQSLA